MALDAKKIEATVKEFSSLTRLLIGLGIDAFKALRMLWTAFRPTLTEAEQDQVLLAMKADAGVREALARADASGERGPVPEGVVD